MRSSIARITQKASNHYMVVHVTKATPLTTRSSPCLHQQMAAMMSTSKRHTDQPKKNYRLLVIGGGTGGCAIAAKFCKQLGAGNVGVIEPADTHYYQPMWTLVGGGVKNVRDTGKPMASVLPAQCEWIKDRAVEFNPKNNSVTTERGHEIKYDFLVVGMGMQLNFDMIKGAPEALANDKRVVSNYNQHYVVKTFPALQEFKGGNAVFTVPNTPIKCAGAPQKIMYLADHYFRKTGKRDNANLMLNSAMGAIFSVKKYADSLEEVVARRGMKVNYKLNLIEVNSDKSEAIFKDLDSDTEKTQTFKYDLLHVVPPMSAPDVLKESCLVDDTKYLNVNKHSLQHVEYSNIFGLGDCANVPTSKTAAAVASQSGILWKNLDAAMAGKEPVAEYNGYTSCPLITAYGKCILAEFDYAAQPKETFPFDQSKERRTMYYTKKDIMPVIYWRGLLNGLWEGPAKFRKLFHPLSS